MRKLAIFALSFSAAVLISQYLLDWKYIWILGAAFGLVSVCAVFLRDKRRLFALLAAIGLSIGFFYDYAFEFIFYYPAEALDGYTGDAELTVRDFPVETDYGYKVSVKVKYSDRRTVSATLYGYDQAAPDFIPGDHLTAQVRLKLADSVYGEKTDIFISRGDFLFAYSTGDIYLTERGSVNITNLHRYAARAMKNKISEIFPSDVSPFATALLTGDKTELKEDTYLVRSLTTAGIYHIVAVSGMHVAFLVGFIRLFTRKRRLTAFICIPVIVFYIALTGASASVTRAGIMQIFLLAAPLFKRENDNATSLSAALMLLLLIDPFSVKNAGLQLSFCAAAGMQIFSGRLYTAMTAGPMKLKIFKNKFAAWLLRTVSSTLSATFGATILTLPLTVIYFGMVPVISPVTALCAMWAVSLAFGASLIACLAGFIWTAAGAALAWCAAWIFRYIILIAEALAKFPFASLYTVSEYVLYWLIYLYCSIVAFIALKGTFRRSLIPVSLAAATLCLAILLPSLYNDTSRLVITAIDVGQGESILLNSRSVTALVDCGGNGSTNAGDTAAEYIRSTGSTKLDMLILTHYHEDHANGVEELLNRLDVGTLIVPEPYDDGDSWLADEILALARSRGVDIIYVTRDMSLTFGDATLDIYSPLGGYGINERGLTVLCSIDDFQALMTGDMASDTERTLVATHDLPDVELLFAGHHGSKYSTGQELLDAVTPEAAIISVGYNTYGHPTPETLQRLYGAGANVYRTDQCGNITVRVK